MNALAAIIVKMAIGLLDYFLARKGIRDGVKKDIALRAERLAKDAEAYKAENPIELKPGDIVGPFRVVRKPTDKPKRLSDKDPRSS